MARPLEEVQQEYARVSCDAGNKQYQITAIQDDLKLLNEKLKNLNIEAFNLQKAKDEETKTEVAP